MCGLALIVTLSVAACGRPSAPSGRYLATGTALDVGRGIRLCIGIDPRDPHGVWWWGPGVTGCATRSTGPGLMPADRAVVSGAAPSGPTAVAFRVGTHSLTDPYVDVHRAIDQDRLRSLDTGDAVDLQRRHDLEIPERPPGP